MAGQLLNKRVAILVTDGFEESEFAKPYETLQQEGAQVDVVSLKEGKVKAWANKDWGKEYPVDKTLDEVSVEDYDALVLPGGVMNPDTLRMHEDAVDFAADFLESGKPVAAICHGPWTLLETGLLEGIKVTSWPSLKTDLTNAGAKWIDEEVVVDKGIITSRKPADLPAFCKKLVEEIKEGIHTEREE